MTFEEYQSYDATALAALIKKNEVTPLELLDIAIKRTEEVNPELNAVVTKLYDLAKQQIKTLNPDAPFAGVPYLIKDLGPQLKGTRYTCGSRFLANNISTANSAVTDRMLNAGLVIFGKTNTPEFGITPFTEGEFLGIARNPHNHAHTTGGSSGGSAAAVAAGIVPMASANDGGGSIRIPASCCGIFGLKPTRGRVSLGPENGELWGGAVCEGVVSRSVRDSALYYDLVQGATEGDPYKIQKPKRPYAEEVKTHPGKLKIGYSVEHPFGVKQDEENILAVEKTVKLLHELGHEVHEVKLPFKKELMTQLLYAMVYGELSAVLDYLGEKRGSKPRRNELEANNWLLYKLGHSFSANSFALAKLKWNEACRAIADFHRQYDLFLTPTLGMRPFKIGALQNNAFEQISLRAINALGISSVVKYTGLIEKTAAKIFSWIPYAPLANVTGQPAMTMPLHMSADGLPVGVMFTAPLNDEATLFRLAGQISPYKGK
jgi:amidase